MASDGDHGRPTNDLPDGAIAYREYEVPMPDGTTANLAFTLGDMTADSIPAEFARRQGALAYGLVSVIDVPGAPRHALIWLQGRTPLALTVADEDSDLGEPLQQAIARCMAVFFADIAPVAPQIAALQLKLPEPANDTSPDRT
ncbi:hypothetical protein [Reyranella sp.]|jgi:hypothetical protein|uniref:hypothetical protein n=1 Tax=Reyranella sp. TaxID=1929291 RepID=UPI002F94EC32